MIKETKKIKTKGTIRKCGVIIRAVHEPFWYLNALSF